MKHFIDFLKKMNRQQHILALALMFGVAFVYAIGSANAIGMFANVNIDGGGGGGDYSYTDTQIPEITPPQPTDLTADYVSGTGTVQGTNFTTIQVPDTLWYAWNRWSGCNYTTGCLPSSDTSTQGWVVGLGQPNITIGYDVRVLDKTSGQEVADNNVSVGQQITLKFMPYVSDNIFWFGTGYSMDSPYGSWSTNAAPPARVNNRVTCDSKDFVVKYTLPASLGYGSLVFDVYVPFQVHPPARSIVPTSLSGLSCGSLTSQTDGSQTMDCTVQNTGTMTPTFKFDATYGKFYYRYYDYRTEYVAGCYGNNIPMAKNGNPSGPTYNTVSTIYPAYQVTIPEKQIPVTLTASNGTDPRTPTMTNGTGGAACPGSAYVNQDIVVNLNSTDPGNLQVRYGVDWDTANPAQEVTSGWTSYVNSGTTQSLTKVGGYATPGVYTIYGRAQNTAGAYSGWGSCNITVNPLPQCSDGIDNDGNGQIDYPADTGCSAANDTTESPVISALLVANPIQVVRTRTTTLTWSSTNATSCTGTGFSTGNATSGSVVITPTTNTTYTVTCVNANGQQAQDTEQVQVVDADLQVTASPASVRKNSQTTINWSVVGSVTSCTISGPGLSSTALSGSQLVTITQESTYTYSCNTASGTVTKSVTVKVLPSFQEF